MPDATGLELIAGDLRDAHADSVLGTVFFALALQRGDVTTVTAVTFMLELLVPSLLGVVLFGDGVLPGQLPLAGLGFVLANASSQFDTAGVFAALIVIMLLAFLLNALVRLAEKWLMPWKAREAEREVAI